MKLHFFGAARAVTGSCYMLETRHGNVLVDCGMRQGVDAKSGFGEDLFAFDPKAIDCVLLTHAHIDHTGLVPLLYKRGFRGKVVCTGATVELCAIMLPDSGHIQENEADWQNRKRERQGKDLIEPMYTAQDARDCMELFQPVEYGGAVEVLKGVAARFTDVGHMLGSSQIEVWVDEDGSGESAKFLFSGDIGNTGRPLLNDPSQVVEADFVIMEGTYGDRIHDMSVDGEAELAEFVRQTVKRGGNLVIPAFAVGRTQELLFMFFKMFRNGMLKDVGEVPVYIDSPLGIEATKIFERVPQSYFDEETKALLQKGINPLEFPSLRIAQTVEESMLINADKTPKVIISSSGMCEAGRIRHHLKHNLWRAESTVLFAGYQAVGTLGRMLVDGVKKVKLFGEEISVNARIAKLQGMSGHADKLGLEAWLGHLDRKPERVFLMHGEMDTLHAFANDLVQRGYAVGVPHLGDAFDTLTHSSVWPETTEIVRASYDVAGICEQAERITALLDRARDGSDVLLEVLCEDMRSFVDKWERLLK